MKFIIYTIWIHVLLATVCVAGSVIVVRGTASAPDAAERNYANRLTDYLDTWLTTLDLPHRVIDDEDVTADSLRNASVVILPYNPNPPTRELDALERYLDGGGKLLVCYAAEPRLAAMMQMRLGNYRMEQRAGQWQSFRFHTNAPPHLPEQILQTSRNVRPAIPIPGQSQTIATWQESGPTTDDPMPAWVQSSHGFWMSHVVLSDGDIWNKQRMLLALLAYLDPSLWEPAARASLAAAATLGRFSSLTDALLYTERLAAGTPREKPVADWLARVRALSAEGEAMIASGRYAEAVAHSRRIHESLVTAFGLTQQPRPGEFRGVWNHNGAGLYPGDWERTCQFLKAHGLTDILSNLLWPGLAHYDSDVLAESETHRLYGDQMEQALAAAHRNGLRLHAWKVCWRLDSAPADQVEAFRREGRLQVSDTGHELLWLCPSDPRNLRFEKDAVRELVRRYDIDGIHLDYIRYVDSHVCYCNGCRTRFEKHLGKRVTSWPYDAHSGNVKRAYGEWRTEQITRLVRDVSAIVRDLRPTTTISAAVFGRYPLCIDSVGQDWGAWLEKGIVDFVCPMNYTDDTHGFTTLTRRQLALANARGKIYPGIGVTAAESRLSAIDTMEQIAALRREGAGGFVLYELNRILETEILPALSLGTTLNTLQPAPLDASP
ncbi:MAG: family 10 glycosylhydrolase [Verrucomicrobia bacterium]|nr:family 10 glycosylhydrolase [Verrucomicrobiota bacterium]